MAENGGGPGPKRRRILLAPEEEEEEEEEDLLPPRPPSPNPALFDSPLNSPARSLRDRGDSEVRAPLSRGPSPWLDSLTAMGDGGQAEEEVHEEDRPPDDGPDTDRDDQISDVEGEDLMEVSHPPVVLERVPGVPSTVAAHRASCRIRKRTMWRSRSWTAMTRTTWTSGTTRPWTWTRAGPPRGRWRTGERSACSRARSCADQPDAGAVPWR
jgi:hypothetical protein